jgi:hypothetical protein
MRITAPVPKEAATRSNNTRGQQQGDRLTGSQSGHWSKAHLVRRDRTVLRTRTAGIDARRESCPGLQAEVSNVQQRRGGRIGRGHDVNSNVADVKNRPDNIAAPRSHSSVNRCFVSTRMLLIRVFHGVNCESVALRDGRGESGQTIDAPKCAAIRELSRSAGTSAICDPRDGPPIRIQAISVNITDRPQVIPMSHDSEVSRISSTTLIEKCFFMIQHAKRSVKKDFLAYLY